MYTKEEQAEITANGALARSILNEKLGSEQYKHRFPYSFQYCFNCEDLIMCDLAKNRNNATTWCSKWK